MTVEEWVDEIRVWHGQEARGHAIKVMRAAIVAAVEEEREACAQLLESEVQAGQVGEFILAAMARQIRARSNPAE